MPLKKVYIGIILSIIVSFFFTSDAVPYTYVPSGSDATVLLPYRTKAAQKCVEPYHQSIKRKLKVRYKAGEINFLIQPVMSVIPQTVYSIVRITLPNSLVRSELTYFVISLRGPPAATC